MKIGILGGTFDPVHFGHLHLAIALFERHQLDEIFWIPVHINPLKNNQPEEAKHRIEMLNLALEGLPHFKVLDIEIAFEGPSYTIDTVRALKKMHPQDELYLLMGEDALLRFNAWKEPFEILRLAIPLIGARQSHTFPETLSMPDEMLKILKQGWSSIPLVEISATELRKRLKENKFCGHMAPQKVLDYIRQHALYLPQDEIEGRQKTR
jgi:nicotinate-nucleotide adenylyltransferase